MSAEGDFSGKRKKKNARGRKEPYFFRERRKKSSLKAEKSLENEHWFLAGSSRGGTCVRTGFGEGGGRERKGEVRLRTLNRGEKRTKAGWLGGPTCRRVKGEAPGERERGRGTSHIEKKTDDEEREI